MKGSASAPQLGDGERHALRHEAGDEGYVAGKPVQLRDDDRAFARLAATKLGRNRVEG